MHRTDRRDGLQPGAVRQGRGCGRFERIEGSLDYPFNPLSIALGAEATFVARAIDTDKAALTEITSRCDAGSHKILDGYSARFAEANASIADLQKQLMVQGPNGVQKDTAVQKKINVLEAQKTDLLGSQDRELSTLREQCQVERTTETKRQADRDASRSMVKR